MNNEAKAIEISTSEKKRCREIMTLVNYEFSLLSDEGKAVFSIMLAGDIYPEAKRIHDEIKKRG